MWSRLSHFLRPHWFALCCLWGTWGIFFSWVFLTMVSRTEEGIFFHHPNVWSDWPLHIGLIRTFALKDPSDWFVSHPFFAGGRLTYPFLSHLLHSLLVRGGVDIVTVLTVPSALLALTGLTGLYFLFWRLLQSQRAALLGISLLFLSSGLGGVQWVQSGEWRNLDTLLMPSKEFSRWDDRQWYSGNVVVGMLVPQRAFLAGFTLAVWSWFLLLQFGTERSRTEEREGGRKQWLLDRSLLLFAGLLAGLLPITHMHSFIALVFLAGTSCVFHLRQLPRWLWYAVPAGFISSFLFWLFVRGGIQTDHFMTYAPGWTMESFPEWVRFWAWAWGGTWVAAMVGAWVLARSRHRKVLRYWAGFPLLFALANLVLLQPVAWDNSKIFLWVLVGVSALGGYGLSWLSRVPRVGVVLTAVLFLGCSFTGGLELLRLSRTDQTQYLGWSSVEIALGEWVATHTPPTAVFATNPSHNHWVMSWGVRPMLLGFTPWVSNFGFPYAERETDLKILYTGTPASAEILKKYGISYVVIGSAERANYPDLDQTWFDENLELVFSTLGERIYKTKEE